MALEGLVNIQGGVGFFQGGDESLNALFGDVHVGFFAPAEHELYLDLVPLAQEFRGFLASYLFVVRAHFYGQADALDFYFACVCLFGAGFFFAFVFELPVVKESAHGWFGFGRHFHQVVATLLCERQRLFGGHHVERLAVFVNHADFGDTNVLVRAVQRGGCGLWPAAPAIVDTHRVMMMVEMGGVAPPSGPGRSFRRYRLSPLKCVNAGCERTSAHALPSPPCRKARVMSASSQARRNDGAAFPYRATERAPDGEIAGYASAIAGAFTRKAEATAERTLEKTLAVVFVKPVLRACFRLGLQK